MVHQTGLSISFLNRPKLLQALYENMMIEIPFASFFLSKMLGQVTITLNILTSSLILWQNKLVDVLRGTSKAGEDIRESKTFHP
jgi:hypothetical protein